MRYFTPLFIPLALLMTAADAPPLAAQRVVVGAGLSVGTIPRALEPLCGSARRLRGVGVTARAGVALGRFEIAATLDYNGRFGVGEAAECIARSGVHVDSVFAEATNSAAAVGLTGWLPLTRAFRVGAEAGLVAGHSSWFVGPALGAQIRNVRIEVAARRHTVTFDEVTRNYASGNTTVISRTSASEGSWGAIARVLLLRL